MQRYNIHCKELSTVLKNILLLPLLAEIFKDVVIYILSWLHLLKLCKIEIPPYVYFSVLK
jgi:hypothetical protein